MKKNRIIGIILILIVFAMALFIDVKGFMSSGKPLETLTSLEKAITPRFGLDLHGGVRFVLEATDTSEVKVTFEAMDTAVSVIKRRVNNLGISEAVVVQERGTNWKRIDVELPGWKDPERARQLIGQTALLQFKTEDGNVVLTGADLTSANLAFSKETETLGQPIIEFKLNSEGAKIFADVTQANIGKKIAIYLDNKLLMNPVVNSAITGGEGIIEGGFTQQEAADYAALLRSGSLPVKLDFISEEVVGPSLGAHSIRMALIAVIAAIILIFIYMIVFYRLLGLFSVLSLTIYLIIEIALLFLLHATLSLPAIGGAILSLGMSVDINVIVFERMKEELKLGKSIKSVISAGFTHALRTVVDSNLTVLVGAALLFYLGTGVIKGFAVTTTIGILVGFFSGIVVSRVILNLFLLQSTSNKPWLFGI
jgi:preprotein translocase subunit SecD